MKRIFLSLFLSVVISFSTYSQNTEDSFALRINYIFQYVDKNQIPTGILSDYGIDFLNLDNYTGQQFHDSNYVGNKEWFALYNSIYSSQVRLISALPSPEVVANLFNQHNLANQPTGLAIMNYSYNAYRDDAVSAGLVTISNDQIFDVPGRTESPYLTKTLFAVTPATNTTVASNDLFVFKSDLVFTNSTYSISSLEADKGNGYFSVSMNTPFSFGFTTSGIYNVKFRITLSNNTQLISQTKIFVKPVDNGGGSQRYAFNPNPTLSTTINGSKPYLGTTGFCNVQVHLSTTNTTGQIRRPLIVVEGFDPWRIVFPNEPGQNYNSESFIREVDRVNLITGGAYDFNEVLDVTGQYDLIFVDFDNGTDHIQRNAFVVDAVIRWVNSIKTTWNGVRQQNVIMGLSMGGLCTRYALRDMENNNINHECRLFISHDVPHQGANVPVGIQMAAQHLGSTRVSAGLPGLYVINIVPNLLNPFAQIRDLQTLSESPAARQMLIQRVIYDRYNNVNGMFTISKTEHQNFQNEIDQLGWPLNSRNVSVSNAICNTNLLFPDNSQLFSFTGQRTSTYFGQLWQSLAATLAGIFSNVGTFWEFPLSIVSTKTSLNVDIWSKAVPPNFQNSQIYNGDIFIKRKILWLININTYLTKSRGYSGSTAYPLDNSPAGVYDLNQFGFDQAAIQAQLPNFFSGFVNVSINQSGFGFVPKMSSLNITNPFGNLRTNTCNSSLVCEGRTTFANYYSSPTSNELHISYNRPNAEFIFAEMQGNPPPLNLPPSPAAYKIYETNDCNYVSVLAVGSNPVCYDWEVTGDLLINGSVTSLTCTSASVNINSTSGLGGTIRVRVMSGTCYSAFTNICFTPCLPWDNPNFQWIWSAPMTGEPLQAQVDEYPGATSYQWFVNGQLIETTNTGFLSTYNWPCTSEGEGLTVLAVTECGRTIAVGGGNYSPICYGRSAYNVKLFPNPASSNVSITLDNNINSKTGGKSIQPIIFKEIRQVKIFDKLGNLKKAVNFGKGNKTVNLNVSNLLPNVYYLEISDGINKAKIPIIIKR
ncbi:MAG: hypothetical protein JST23_01835 [Bacteroidetes bacterium]|nr:hypothetical protein [Bacteroidota bacterium]